MTCFGALLSSASTQLSRSTSCCAPTTTTPTPATGHITHPIGGERLNLASTDVHKRNKAFLQSLELQADLSLRAGELAAHGYKLNHRRFEPGDLGSRPLEYNDFVPDIEQKGVDLRIGLDIARLSLRGLVRTIVCVTGDSDFIPAFTFARREGVRVVLAHMGHGVKRDLKAHTDLLLDDHLVPEA